MKLNLYNKRFWVTVLSVVLFIVLIVWLLAALGNTEAASQRQQMESVKNTIENGITLCYSIEGTYPESLEYLVENYGVHYNSDNYIIHYECFAANIRPTLTVIEKDL